MATVIRYDLGQLQKPRKTAQGFLRVDAHASRVGIQEYRDAAGNVRRELRLPEEVFAPSSLEGFEGAPFTDDHPTFMVDAKNAGSVAKGTVLGSGRKDGDHVAVSVIVTDAELIAKLESGAKRQVSVGYQVELDLTPGTHPVYGAYDAIQRSIVPNHLACVERGRAGPSAAVRMDDSSAVATVQEDAPTLKSACKDRAIPHTDLKMAQPIDANRSVEAPSVPPGAPRAQETTIMDELTKQLAASLADALAQKTRADQAEANLAAATARAVKAEADKIQAEITATNATAALAAETARVDAAIQTATANADKARKDADDSVSVRVTSRVALETAANRVLGADKASERSSLSDRDIKIAVIKHVDGIDVPADKVDLYIDGVFDGALDRHAKGVGARADVRQTINQMRNDGAAVLPKTGRAAEKAARSAMSDHLASAWMTPSTK